MSNKITRISRSILWVIAAGLIIPALAFAHPAVRLLDANGMPIKDQLNPSDTVVAANGSVYMRGPAYSPKQTCGKCHDYQAITRAYHFHEGAGAYGQDLSDHWSVKNKDNPLYRYLANAYGHLISPGQFGAW
ncbi:MAG: hypothetical protein ACPL2F_01910 [Dissulfurimicrobium hydrothermale]|uniref:hypothetical protein n=1 Tax=Dissulfurimicrobium hydrothermale TaxID=1750598 RepID=UPI003C770132